MLFSGFPAIVESIDSGLFVPQQSKKQNGMDFTRLSSMHSGLFAGMFLGVVD